MRRIVWIFIYALALFCFAGCGLRTAEATEPVFAAVSEPEASIQEDLWVNIIDPDRICIQFQPTETTTLANVNLYYIPADQESWLREFTSAIEKADMEKHWVQGDSSYGIFIYYQDEMWQFLGNGDLQAAEFGRVSAEDAAVLYNMCAFAAERCGMDAPVRPVDIQNLSSAVLDYQGIHTITDPEKLGTLERWLSGATAMRDNTKCPLEAMLTLTREDGARIKLRLATDSCCVWMSEGAYYRYGESDNEKLLAFFTDYD